ncbi:hypothetical protein FOA52_015553 [Chlamydomonas sp. UWO 241]|nr:hypothetical protein FOA52_015553 [Chlamydomonas sp. UWO 241]
MVRRSALAGQPARRPLSIVVRSSQPGPHLNPPDAASEAWVASQRAWVDLAVNQPAELSGTDAKGVPWSSSVYLLGVSHDSPANARSVHEVAAAVKPDAAGWEFDSSNSTLNNRMKTAAQSAPMMKFVPRLMDTPIESHAQARGQLTVEERKEWEECLRSAHIGLSVADTVALHKLARPAYADGIAAAFIAREFGAPFVFIDCPDGRSMYKEAAMKLHQEDKTAVRSVTEQALGESLAVSFRWWKQSDPRSRDLQFAVNLAMAETLLPEAMPSTLTAYPKERREANAQRERGMCRTINDLCSGKLVGKPRKRVLAIVGKNHVAPLIELLKAA